MPRDIGKTLKEYRIAAKMSVKEISDFLTSKGFKASESTIYSWENENSQPTPGALLTMCDAYGIQDILSTFGYNGYKEDGSLQLNINEVDLIEKYRNLDDHGKEHINTVLEWETQRVDALNKVHEEKAQQSAQIIELEKVTRSKYFKSYYQRMTSAGSGEYLFDDIPTDLLEVADTPIARKADFVIGVNGQSMEPDYMDGERVFVKKSEEIPTGSIGVFLRGSECFIKELGTDRLISHNPNKETYPDIPASEDMRCVGLVLGKIED